jgi:hypothetical protein
MKKLLCPILITTALAAGAAEFNAGQVPSQARWVAHLDVDALRKTQLGEMVMGHLKEGTPANQIEAVKAMFGVDLRTDIHGFTACGASNKPQEAAVIAHATMDPERLLSLLKLNQTYTGEAVGEGLTLHSWMDEKKPNQPRQYGMFVGDRVVISGGKEAMKAVATSLLGKGDSLATSQGLDTAPFKGAVFAAAANLEGIADRDPKAAMLKNAKSAVVSLSEAGEWIVGRLVVSTVDEATAAQMNAMASGMLAFVQLNQEADPQVKKLAQGLSVTQNGNQIQVQIKLPVGEIKEKLEEQIRKQEMKKNA